MTYWAAAIVDNQIVMAADSRVSIQLTSKPLEISKKHMYAADDVSEKLFTNKDYAQSHKLCIVTSGSASFGPPVEATIAEILKNFIGDSYKSSKSYVTAEDATNSFVGWCKLKYKSSAKLIIQKAHFCFGVINQHGKASLAAMFGNEKESFIQPISEYIEADSKSTCYTIRYGDKSIKEAVKESCGYIPFIESVIEASKEIYSFKTIGGATDYALMGTTKFEVRVGPKELVTKASFLGPMLSEQNDRASVPTSQIGVPSDLIDADPSRMAYKKHG